VDLESVADELYALLPGEFTAARNEFARHARRAGQADLAAAVTALRRPTAAAWLANTLTREQPDLVRQLIGLGGELRDAQTARRGEELRRLTAQRREVVAEAVRQTRRLAGDHGQPVSEATVREVQATLDAALADPRAGEAVLSGRLVTGLTYTGLGDVEVDSAMAVTAARQPPPPAVTSSRAPRSASKPAGRGRTPRSRAASGSGDHDHDRAQRERVAAAAAKLDDARTMEAEAESEVAARQRRVSEVTERVDGLTRQLEALDEQLGRVRRESADAARVRKRAERDVTAARAALRDATKARAAAQAQLTRVEPPG
jgi:hypothetical protein